MLKLKNIKLKPKLTGLFLLVGLIPLIIAAWWSSRIATNQLMEKSYGQLSSVREIKKVQIQNFFEERKGDMKVLIETVKSLQNMAFEKLTTAQQLKKSQIETYFEERFGDVQVLSKNNHIAEALSEFNSAFETDGKSVKGNTWKNALTKYEPWIKSYKETYGYYDLFLITLNGNIVYTVEKESDLGQNVISGSLKESPLGKCFQKSTSSVFFQDFEPYSPSDNQHCAFIGAPIAQGSDIIGVLVLQLPTKPINEIVGKRDGMGGTGETYLIGSSSGKTSFRSDPQIVGKGNFKIGTEYTTVFIENAMSGKSGNGIMTDKNGDLVMSIYNPLEIKGVKWACITRMAVEEAIVPKEQGAKDDYFARYIAGYGYYDLFLIHPEGHVFYTVSHESDYGTNMINGKYASSNLGKLIRQVLQNNQYGMADFAPYAPSNNEPSAFIAQPVITENQTTLVVALQLSLEAINKIMQQREGMGKTGETYLIGSDKLMRSDSFLDATNHTVKASFANPAKGSVDTESAKDALSGKTDQKVVMDYNGNPVLSAYTPIKLGEYVWALLAEIDQAEVYEPIRTMIMSIVIIGLIVAVVVAVFALFIANSIATPMIKGIEFAKAIANGDFGKDIDINQKDEIGNLVDALKAMKQKVQDVVKETEALIWAVQEGRLDTRGNANDFMGSWKELIKGINKLIDAFVAPINLTAEYIDRISKGDIPQRITEDYKGDFNEIKNNINGCIDSINGLVAETNMLIQAGVNGKLDIRGNASKFGGDFGRIIKGINDTLDAVIGPLNVAAEYIDRISKGDIPQKVTEDYKGDFNEIKNNINQCIDSISGLVSEMATMTHNALDGKLDKRGDVKKYSGDFSKIIQGVNDIIDAIVEPLKMAANIVDKISKGEIPTKVSAQYKGDYNEIKNNLNLLIESTADVTKLAQKIAVGDLSVKVKKRSDQDELMQALDDMVKSMKTIVTLAQNIAAGDLKVEVKKRSDEDTLMKAFEAMVKDLTSIAVTVQTAADQVASGSHQISTSAQEMSQGATEQAASVEEVSSSMEQMSSTVAQNADNARETAAIAGKAAVDAQEGGRSVSETVNAMRSIADKISIIEEIARQTNMLALNAAIEAARAGEHGKGFAVVASEVRKLAERSQTAAKEISTLSSTSVEIAEKAGKLIADIVPSIQKTAELVQEINVSSAEQSDGIQQVTKAVQQLDQVIQQSATVSEQVASTSEELNGQAEQLREASEFFKVEGHKSTASTLVMTKKDGKKIFQKGASKKVPQIASEKRDGVELDLSDHTDDEFERY